MATTDHPQSNPEWTAVQLADRFGPLPLSRVWNHPAPGTAAESDVVAIHEREKRLCELIDGILVEKTVGAYESYLAIRLSGFLSAFLAQHNLGILFGADGMIRFAPQQVRIPDVSFVSWQRLPDGRFPHGAMLEVSPDLAVEIISPGNTREEMDRKLADYFAAGVRLVWYVYPAPREVHVFTKPDDKQVLAADHTLTGGDVLPGFELPLAELFVEPTA